MLHKNKLCQQLFSGLLVNFSSIGDWLSWIRYLSIFRYSLNVSLMLQCLVRWCLTYPRKPMGVNVIKVTIFSFKLVSLFWCSGKIKKKINVNHCLTYNYFPGSRFFFPLVINICSWQALYINELKDQIYCNRNGTVVDWLVTIFDVKNVLHLFSVRPSAKQKLETSTCWGCTMYLRYVLCSQTPAFTSCNSAFPIQIISS